ncbi:hypothetical protein FKW77_004835 [Venturia effusa]|uniref:Uncharacterized protein n=1 Tax=Venturia effusa TaxID=50376 RepID=A0A517LH45_9PEZI|nr:hypothetical protein FKW77_004835 [Venturia effusa]
MLPWHWFSSKSSATEVEPGVVDAQSAEPLPATSSIEHELPIDRTETNKNNKSQGYNKSGEETGTINTPPPTLEEQLAAARDRMKRSSMVAEALSSDMDRPRASMPEQQLRGTTSSGAPSSLDTEPGSKRRHSRHNSVEARPGAPRRSSSVKNVFNAYYKIFGGKPPSKPPASEQPVDETARLRRMVRRYERQLEEASNTIMLQDKVLAKWESKVKNLKSDDSVLESSPRGLDSLEGTHFESSSSDPVNRLANIQESSREMLADFASLEEGGEQTKRKPVQANPSTIAEVLRLTKELQAAQANVESLTKELEAAQATVQEQLVKHAELQQQNSQSLESAVQSRQELETEVQSIRAELEVVKSAHSETLTFLETVKRTLSEEQASHLETASELRETQARLAEKSQLILLHETTLSDKDAERDALLAGHETTLSQTNQDLAVAREKIVYLETQVDTISKEYQDAKTALEAAQSDLEVAKSGVSNAALERDAVKADFDKVSADYEVKSKEHQEIRSALETAQSELHQCKSIAESAKMEAATLQEQLTSLQKELEDTKVSLESANSRIAELLAAAELHESAKEDVEKFSAEIEELKQELGSHKASRAEIDEQLRSLQSNVDQHVASKDELQKNLDDHIAAKSLLERELEDHVTAKTALQAELDNHVASKAELQRSLDDNANAKSILQAELEDHVAAKSLLQKELDDQVASKSSLQQELENNMSTVSSLRKELEDHVSSKSILQQELETHINSLSVLQKQLEDHATTQAALEKQLEQLPTVQAELEAAQAKISELQTGSDDQVRALQADVDAHVKSKADLEAELEHFSNLKSEHDVALAKLAELEAKTADNQAQLVSANARIAELMTDVENHAVVQSEHASALSQLAESKQQVDAHAARIDELNKEIEGHAAVKADLENAQVKVADLTKLVDAHGSVESELELYKEQVAALSKAAEKHDATKADLESHREQVATLSKAIEDHQAKEAELDSHREQVATLSKAVEGHEVVRKELDSHREQVAALLKAAEEHSVVEAELESHREQVATLSKAVEEHESVLNELESHREQVATLSKAVEEHAMVKADLETHREKVATLSKAVEDNAAVKAELETHRQRVAELTEAVENHESVKSELGSARTRLADLEKDVEAHKADKETISEQLASAEAALVTATQSHEELSTKAKDAEERLRVAEKALQSSKEDHEANLASLSAKTTAMERLQEHNTLLQQELNAALDSERAAKLAIEDLRKKLKAIENKEAEKATIRQDSEIEKSQHSDAAVGAAAIGLAGAGAAGLVKDLADEDEVEANKAVREEKPEIVEEQNVDPGAEKESQSATHGDEEVEISSPPATSDVEKPALTREAAEEDSLTAPGSEQQSDDHVHASSEDEMTNILKDTEESPAEDKAVDLTRSQDTLYADEDDPQFAQVQSKDFVNQEDESSVLEELKSEKSDAPEFPVEELEQMLGAHDDDKVKAIDETAIKDEGQMLKEVENTKEDAKSDSESDHHPTMRAQEVDTIGNDVVTEEHDANTIDLSTAEDTSFAGAEADLPKTAMEEISMNKDDNSTSETAKSVDDENASVVPEKAHREEEPKTSAVHHSLKSELEPVTMDDIAVDNTNSALSEYHPPPSPVSVSSTKSKRKSVRWEDIESAKSSPFEEKFEMSGGLGVPWLLNGDRESVLSAEPDDALLKDVPEASRAESPQQEASSSVVDDEGVDEKFKDESGSPMHSAVSDIPISTDAPEISERSPDRFGFMLEPDQPARTTKQAMSDKVLDEPEEATPKSEDLEGDLLPISQPVGTFDEPSIEEIGVHAGPDLELSDNDDEHIASSNIQAAIPELSLSEADDEENSKKIHAGEASEEDHPEEKTSSEIPDDGESFREPASKTKQDENEKPQKKRRKGKSKGKGKVQQESTVLEKESSDDVDAGMEIPVLPGLPQIEPSTGIDLEKDDVAAEGRGGNEENDKDEASSQSSSVGVVETTGNDIKHNGTKGDQDGSAYHAREDEFKPKKTISDNPLPLTTANGSSDLPTLSRKPANRNFVDHHDDDETSRKEAPTTFTQDEELTTEVEEPAGKNQILIPKHDDDEAKLGGATGWL